MFQDAVAQITPWLDRLHAVVIGPGMGRDARTLQTVELVLRVLLEKQTHTVIDADGLFLVTGKPHLIQGHSNITITPNAAEFTRLKDKLGMKSSDAMELSALLGGVTVVKKGIHDEIANTSGYYTVQEEGSLRRCGGQGDILSGAIATFTHWANDVDFRRPNDLTPAKSSIMGAYAGCQFLKVLARETYFGERQYGSVLASDMANNIASLLASDKFLKTLSSDI